MANRCKKSENVSPVTGFSTSGAGRTFTYDAENGQISATVNGQTSTYTYDGEGRRVKKSVNGVDTVFVYDPFGNLAQEYGPSTDTGTKYITADHLGSTRLVTTSAGTVDKCYDYLPFGEELGNGTAGRTNSCYGGSQYPNAADKISNKFTSKERDAETGLDYFGARYFSSAQGRFTTVDPVFATASLFNPQSWNGYTYTPNNPLKYVDSSGESPTLVSGAIGLGIGFVGGGLFNLGGQLARNGFDFDKVDGHKVFNAALGGGVSGLVTGLTLGIGTAAVTATELAVAGGAGNVLGGITNRRLDEVNCNPCETPNTGSEELVAVGVDAALGAAGSLYGAHVADKNVAIPQIRKQVQELQFAHRRSLRPQRIAQAQAAYQATRQTNEVVGGVAGQTFSGYFNDLWNWIRPDTSKAQKPVKACVTYSDSQGNSGGGCE